MKRSAVFFDRDGVVNKRIFDGYVRRVTEFELIPSFINALLVAKSKGYLAILITNQQGVGKEIMTEGDLLVIHNYMQNKLKELCNRSFDDIFFCSDLANTGSPRRKPEPGMLFEAIERHNIDAQKSWFVGDSLSDIEAGNRAKVNTILVSEELEKSEIQTPTLQIPKMELLSSILEFLPLQTNRK